MTSDRRECARRSRQPATPRLLAPLLVAALALPGALPAQVRSAGETRSARTSDSLRRQRAELLVRLDSLRRQFDEEPLTIGERQQLSAQLTSLVLSLAELSRMNVDMRRVQRDAERAAAKAAAAMPMAWSSWREAMPRGWIGINVDAPQVHEVRGQEQYVRYFDYPEIVSVEPNSPAEHAGIAAGDVLVAYNGADVRDRMINVTRLLRPHVRVRVTVDRDGDRREFAVQVAPAPQQFQMRRMELVSSPLAPGAPMPPMPAPPAMAAMPSVPAMPAMPGEDAELMTAPSANIDLVGPTGGVFGAPGFSPDAAPVAGAQLVQTRDRDLARYFGVRHGLLVTDVVPGPARTSGLRGGDVIVRAGDHDITSVAQFRQVVAAHASERAVGLVVVRDRREQRLTLRW